MSSITIGVLLPSSTIAPMGKDFEKGLKKAIKENLKDEIAEIEIIPEFIGPGSKVKVEEAVNKLFGYHDVDIITGIVSNRIGMEVAEKFEKARRPFLMNNIGEHLPDPRNFNPWVFINSTHVWQQVWSLGYWAVKKFGKRGMFVGSVYDAGYSFTSMLKLGMEAADPESVMPFSVAPLKPQQTTADPTVVFQHIEEFKPDFILSVFCGDEASIFQKEYIKSPYHQKIPLLGLPFLLEPFVSEGEALELYSTIVAGEGLSQETLNLEELNSQKPFYSLGAETGLIISEALNNKGDKSLTEALRETKVYSDRGLLHIDPTAPGKDSKVYLVKHLHKGDKQNIEAELIEELRTVSITDPALAMSLDEPSSGWGNPYLGI